MGVTWMTYQQVPWLDRSQPSASLIQCCDTLAQSAGTLTDSGQFLERALLQIGMELGSEWTAMLTPAPTWSVQSQYGRNAPEKLPKQEVAEVLDRASACFLPSGMADSRPGLLVPVVETQAVLIAFGSQLSATTLPAALIAGQTLGRGLVIVAGRESLQQRAERLKSTLAIAQTLAQERETQPLLERMAHEATQLFDCDRASIFIRDRESRQLVACPALGVEGGQLWLPDDKGIVGEVIRTGETINVEDAYADDRFDQSVDRSSGYRTRNLLCAPLYDPGGTCIGAFELINKNGGAFTADDQDGLREFGLQAAITIENSREREQLVRSNRQLTEQARGAATIIGQNPAIAALRSTIDRLAETDLPVLVLGESGTGKEVAAQALHYGGPRADHPFIAVNCAALTESLLESELFGHEKGAFTDAHAAHPGKFELADGGTLFLDEIGDMSLGGQAKLLRVLEQKVVTRVGGSQNIPINVRVVAATNAGLADLVSRKKFRQDLYYRLSVVTVEMPPLRDRPEDVIPLAQFFLEQFCRQANRRRLALSPDARRRLQSHAWPGNVRELRNLMERVAFLSKGDRVEADDIAFILSPQRDAFDELGEDVGLTEATTRFQQEYIRRAIKRVQGNMSDAARILGLHRSNLYRKMRQLEMEVEEEKP